MKLLAVLAAVAAIVYFCGVFITFEPLWVLNVEGEYRAYYLIATTGFSALVFVAVEDGLFGGRK